MKEFLAIIIVIIIIIFLSFESIIENKTIFSYNIFANKGYDSIYDFTYSPDGKSFAFSAMRSGKHILIKDGIEKNYNSPYFLTYSPNGKSFAFVEKYVMLNDKIEIKDIDKRPGVYVVNIDGIESKKYDNIVSLKYSPDGKSFSFIAYKKGKKDPQSLANLDGKNLSPEDWKKIMEDVAGKYILVKDGIESKEYDYVSDFKYSPDGKNYAFIARKGQNYILVKNGVEIEKLDYISGLSYSANGNDLFYIELSRDNGKYNLIKDGTNGKYAEVLKIVYSPTDQIDKKDFTIIAKKDGKEFLFKDGIEGKKYDKISNFSYSTDKKDYAFYAKKDGKNIIIQNGVELPQNYVINGETYQNNILEKPSEVSAYNYYFYLYNGTLNLHIKNPIKKNSSDDYPDWKNRCLRSPTFSSKEVNLTNFDFNYDTYEFKYSPDGKSYIIIALKDGKWFFIKDGIESKKYDDISNFKYSSDGKSFSFVARINGKLYGKGCDLDNDDSKEFLVKDGVEGKIYDKITKFSYAPYGNSYAFIALKDGKYFLVKDGIEK